MVNPSLGGGGGPAAMIQTVVRMQDKVRRQSRKKPRTRGCATSHVALGNALAKRAFPRGLGHPYTDPPGGFAAVHLGPLSLHRSDLIPTADSYGKLACLFAGTVCRAWAVTLCTATIAACGAAAHPARGPTETLRAYVDALERGAVEDAHALLSDDARRELSLDAFRRMVQENPAEIREIVAALSRPASAPVVTATLTTPDGDSLLLVYEVGQWKVDSSAIDLYAQNTPRQTVTSFVRAFEARRYDVLMRFVPDAKLPGLDAKKLREAWEGSQKEEMQRIVPALKSALPTAGFEEVGDQATMPFGAVGTVQLVREHGIWKIEDFD